MLSHRSLLILSKEARHLMDISPRHRRLHYQAWHRGTREADFLVGGFFDAYHSQWNDADLDWFERLIEEQDVDILNWAFGRNAPPPHLDGPLVLAMRKLDYISIPR